MQVVLKGRARALGEDGMAVVGLGDATDSKMIISHRAIVSPGNRSFNQHDDEGGARDFRWPDRPRDCWRVYVRGQSLQHRESL